ncbi:MAG: histone deacetylase family protein [Syntrophales bacterium]
MKVIYHEDFNQVYTLDPAAAEGRIRAIVDVIRDHVTFVEATPAQEKDISAVHTPYHIEDVKRMGIYDIAALAAGGAVEAAKTGLNEPCFGLIRPPGHHASANSSWGFCYFNNMAIALKRLKKDGDIKRALVLDIDLHFGDGTVNILGSSGFVEIHNPSASSPADYMKQVVRALSVKETDIIGISAGFDYAREDWGGVLSEADYTEIGRLVKETAERCGAGYFAILEGGYNHSVLGRNCMALLKGMEK